MTIPHAGRVLAPEGQPPSRQLTSVHFGCPAREHALSRRPRAAQPCHAHGVNAHRRADGSVARFWLVALLGPVAAALVVRSFTDSLSPLTSTVVIAAAMPAPLVAAIVAGHRRWPEIRDSIRRGFDTPRALLVLPVVVLLSWIAGAVAITAVAGNVAGIDGVGRIASDTEDVRATIAEVLDPDAAAAADVPPVPVLVVLGVVGGIIAGFTVNGVLAFGEEYGWRGYLWDQLRGRGRSGTILGVGTLWGLWHAPLILIVGLNYPDQRVAGVAAMVLFAVAASWPLDELRRASDRRSRPQCSTAPPTAAPASSWSSSPATPSGHWPDRNSKFHRYEDLDPTPTIDRLLAEIDADPICIFWG